MGKITKSEKQRIGKCIARFREMAGITIEDVAYDLNVETKVIERWESGDFGRPEGAKYVKFIYDVGKRYNCRVLPNYFKEYYASPEVQGDLLYLESLGYALRRMRQELEFSQDEMAKLTGIHHTAIGDIEKNIYVDPQKKRAYIDHLITLWIRADYVLPPVVYHYISDKKDEALTKMEKQKLEQYGQAMRELRRMLKFTQTALSELTGYSVQTISAIEHGRCNIGVAWGDILWHLIDITSPNDPGFENGVPDIFRKMEEEAHRNGYSGKIID